MIGSLRTLSLVFLVAVSASVVAQEIDYTSDSLDDVKAKVESGKAILVDVREKREWDRGHLRTAVLVPLSKLSIWERDGISEADKAELAKALPKGKVVYCHCAAGARALPGGEALRKLGCDARPLKEGYQALVEAGFAKDTRR